MTRAPRRSTVRTSPRTPGMSSARRVRSTEPPHRLWRIPRLRVTGMAEISLSDVFVELADTLVDDFDVMDFMHVLTERCVQVLDIAAAGLSLADDTGVL